MRVQVTLLAQFILILDTSFDVSVVWSLIFYQEPLAFTYGLWRTDVCDLLFAVLLHLILLMPTSQTGKLKVREIRVLLRVIPRPRKD